MSKAKAKKPEGALPAGITIEKGIPIPEAREAPNDLIACHPRPKWAQLLRQMVRGDSILVPQDRAPAVLSSAHRLGVKACQRRGPSKTLQIPRGKARVWRMN